MSSGSAPGSQPGGASSDQLALDRSPYLLVPYGSRTQWLQNVVAAGTATLVHEGSTYRVDRPELTAIATVADRFSASDQVLFRWLRVEDCLRLRNVDRQERSTHGGLELAGPRVAIARPTPADGAGTHSRAG